MPNLTEALISEVRRDIHSFSDPGTLVELGPGGKITWTKDAMQCEAQLITASGFPNVSYEGKILRYHSFLASGIMADLHHLAKQIVTQIPRLTDYISAPAQKPSQAKKYPNADELLLNDVQPKSLPFGSTRVVFLHGNAGAGKTSLLRYITRTQAERYLEGSTSTLLLYLDAQGKGLSQLEDVMARALQDLRAHFTYHSIATLTRHNCIVPIVDGFDELIGPSSAREAFGNLAQFLAQLDCKGALITSSRSAFIDYRTLHERATEIASAQGLSYEIYPIELVNWDDEFVFRLAGAKLGPVEDRLKQIRTLVKSPVGQLIRKPFFLSHICNIILEGGTISGDQDLVKQVADASLVRETSKLQDKRQKPILSIDQHRRFCQALADEMWLQERSDLDLQTIRTIAELFAEEAGISAEEAEIFKDRSISHGLLKITQGDLNRREFEHELFRFEFQAGRFSSALLAQDTDIKDYILRREIAPDLSERVAAYREYADDEVLRIMSRLSDLAQRSKNSPYAGTNGGIIIGSLIRQIPKLPEGGRITALYFRNENFRYIKMTGWSVRDCMFERTDFSGATFDACIIEKDIFIACRISSKTNFGGAIIDAQMFSGIEDGEGNEYYDPADIQRLLQESHAGVVPDHELTQRARSQAAIKRINLTERFLKHARTHFNLSEDDDWVQTRLRHERDEWLEIEATLRKYRLLMDVITQKSGPPTPIWRLTLPPEDILRGRAAKRSNRPELSNFWHEIERD